MKLYRASIYHAQRGHLGYRWYRRKKDAMEDGQKISCIDDAYTVHVVSMIIPRQRFRLLAFANQYASYSAKDEQAQESTITLTEVAR